jgi:hypothetical protein
VRSLKVLLVAALACAAIVITFKVNPTQAQSEMPPACTDTANYTALLTAMSQGPYVDAFAKIGDAATPDDFANLLDLGIQTQHVVTDMKINPADTGCFYLQIASFSVLVDENEVATYMSFIKAGLKNADAYKKNLTDSQARLVKDLAQWKALATAGLPTPAAATAP